MSVNYSEELSQAFIVGPDELKKLIELLQKRIGEVTIRVDCIDKIERKFSTVKELIDYENPKSKRIRRIHLSARSDNYSKSATIVFRGSFFMGVSINVNGREDVVSRLKEDILDIVTGMRPWYDIVYNSKVSITISFIFGMISMLWILSALGYKIGEIGLINFLRDVMPIQLIASIMFVVVWWFLLKKPYGYLFPQASFLIGQGKSRFKTLEKVRWGVVIAFFVSFAAGLVPLIW